MDAPILLGRDGDGRGFVVDRGAVYRFTAWIAQAAFDALPWKVPGKAEIAQSISAAGWRDLVIYYPWDSLPSDWPSETASAPSDAFVVRGQGTWDGSGILAPAWPLNGFAEPIHVAAVWQHEAAPAPSPPSPLPAPPDPPRPRPRHEPPPGPSEPDPPAPRRRKKSSSAHGVAFVVGGAIAAGVTFLIMRSHARVPSPPQSPSPEPKEVTP